MSEVDDYRTEFLRRVRDTVYISISVLFSGIIIFKVWMDRMCSVLKKIILTEKSANPAPIKSTWTLAVNIVHYQSLDSHSHSVKANA